MVDKATILREQIYSAEVICLGFTQAFCLGRVPVQRGSMFRSYATCKIDIPHMPIRQFTRNEIGANILILTITGECQ